MADRERVVRDTALERAEFAGRTVKELCALLRSGGDYREVFERAERARSALETLRVAIWQRELVRTVSPTRHHRG